MIITKKTAESLIRAGKARSEGLMFCPARQKTYMVLTRFDAQRTDHAPIGAGDLR